MRTHAFKSITNISKSCFKTTRFQRNISWKKSPIWIPSWNTTLRVPFPHPGQSKRDWLTNAVWGEERAGRIGLDFPFPYPSVAWHLVLAKPAFRERRKRAMNWMTSPVTLAILFQVDSAWLYLDDESQRGEREPRFGGCLSGHQHGHLAGLPPIRVPKAASSKATG